MSAASDARLGTRSIARSHIGNVRLTNEDRILNLGERGLWAVADGMGGHAMGDVAAQTVVTTLSEIAPELSAERLSTALAEANRRILDLSGRCGRQCGSTVAGLCLTGSEAIIFWAGDSRVYRWRAGEACLLTRDHRVVQDLVDAGVIDADAARHHPRAAVITRAIGAGPTLDVEMRTEAARTGDTFLICTDGLSDLVDEAIVFRALASPDDEAANTLVNAALAAGGTDNISLVLVTVGGHGADAASPGSTVLGTQF